MREMRLVGQSMVQYNGDYDLGGLYKLITGWLMDRGYEFQDKRFKEKEDLAEGNYMKLDFTGRKKETAYTRLWMFLRIRIWEKKDEERIVDGEKKLITGGRIIIRIQGKVEFDWQDRFTGTKFREVLGSFYNWVMKKEHEILHVDRQEYEVLKLEYAIKKFLKMETGTHAYDYDH
ncbi:MAG: hypothetical protein ABH828_02420 [archaeon]